MQSVLVALVFEVLVCSAYSLHWCLRCWCAVRSVQSVLVALVFEVLVCSVQSVLVALVFEVFAVSVVQQQGVRVVLADPLHLLHVKRALSLHPLPLPAPRNRDGQT